MERNYYVSRYLNVIPLEKNYLLFNGYNGCMDEVTPELGSLLSKVSVKIIFDSIGEGDIEFLVQRGYLTKLSPEEEKTEFKKYVQKLDQFVIQKNKRRGNLMLLLSYSCNLTCYYCYQKPIRDRKGHKKMTKEMIDSIFNEQFKNLYGDISQRHLGITLYGGEPLLASNREAIERVLEYAEDFGVNVSAISNCTQIDELEDLLGPLPGQINFVQVSLDGMEEFHNQSRISSGETETFKKIISNSHLMLDRKVKLNIRINVEAKNITGVKRLYELLRTEEILEHPYAFVYLHPLHNHFDQTDDTTFLTHERTAEIINDIDENGTVRHPIKRMADQFKYLFRMNKGIGLRKTRFCMQNSPNNYLIDPYGDIYGCYEDAGRDEFKIGELLENGVQWKSLYEKNLSRSIVNMERCLECSVALACGGECAVVARKNDKSFYEPFCTHKKEQVHLALKHCYMNLYGDTVHDSIGHMFPHL